MKTMDTVGLKTADNRKGEVLSMDPKKFILWLFIVASIMIFASQTSAYLVKRAEGNWTEFDIPSIFTYSTFVLLLSSLSMHWAYLSAKKDNFAQLKAAVVITFVLGMGFVAMQLEGWKVLDSMNVFFVGNPSGSFFYVFSGLHVVHLFMGLVMLLIALVAAFRMNIHSKRLRLIEICATFWHFLDILWLYLFVFLLTFH